MNKFYVYALFRPWNGQPCYIGKGSGERAYSHNWEAEKHENKHLAAIYRKAGCALPVVILHHGLDEATAFAYEIILISAIGRKDQALGPLANKTDGGEGPSGARYYRSENFKQKVSAALVAHCADPQNAADRIARFKAAWATDEVRKIAQRKRMVELNARSEIKQATIERNKARRGEKRSEEWKAMMRPIIIASNQRRALKDR